MTNDAISMIDVLEADIVRLKSPTMRAFAKKYLKIIRQHEASACRRAQGDNVAGNQSSDHYEDNLKMVKTSEISVPLHDLVTGKCISLKVPLAGITEPVSGNSPLRGDDLGGGTYRRDPHSDISDIDLHPHVESKIMEGLILKIEDGEWWIDGTN